ncbi:ATP-grasp fold amidoligase family protein [Halomonas sp. CS7]|uniref:ATP-grasp fold amidoligase family protein n=1 Tax=Halomonas pelophila TaxID=3151122 RepID=A0ABV1N8J0_9GAMM
MLKLFILRFLFWVPDSLMVSAQYFVRHHRILRLKNPVLYTEKLQCYKLYYRDPVIKKCTDKYNVREFVESRGYGHLLNEVYAAYEHAEEIDVNKLPNIFVMKSTTGGGGRNIIFVDRIKKKVSSVELRKVVSPLFKINKKSAGREWAYYGLKPKVIAEKLLSPPQGNSLTDYKFFCFDGEPYYVLLCDERFSRDGVKKAFFDLNKKYVDIGIEEYQFGCDGEDVPNPRWPENFEEMVSVARDLSQGFPHVRVDLYNMAGKIYFGELTFYDASGYKKYMKLDSVMGKLFSLPG